MPAAGDRLKCSLVLLTSFSAQGTNSASITAAVINPKRWWQRGKNKFGYETAKKKISNQTMFCKDNFKDQEVLSENFDGVTIRPRIIR